MSSELMPIDPDLIKDNPFKLIGDDWMLVTAGTKKSFNTMTASWGALGELWNKKVAFCFVRPTRHTYRFMEESGIYSLSFFDESFREALNFCGKNSGREVDKMKATGLTPVFNDSGAVYFEQARLVLLCRKIYFQDVNPDLFLDPAIHESYPKKDYHRMYIGEVVRCLMRG